MLYARVLNMLRHFYWNGPWNDEIQMNKHFCPSMSFLPSTDYSIKIIVAMTLENNFLNNESLNRKLN